MDKSRAIGAHGGKTMKSNGAVLWQGASLLDGAPIVVIATGLANKSSNAKTGAMIQTYILRADMEPHLAVRLGADVSICGQCPHRGTVRSPLEPGQVSSAWADGPHEKRTCYVNIGQGPLGVYRAWKRGVYIDVKVAAAETGLAYGLALRDIGRGRQVRLGTYGDPAAVPADVWAALVSRAAGHTGYTHQWRLCDPALRTLCMASADSVADAAEAQRAGWRTFRVAQPCDPGKTRQLAEVVCPASAEAGKKLTCSQCMACGGADGRRGNIVINAHGGFAVMTHINSRGVRPYFAR